MIPEMKDYGRCVFCQDETGENLIFPGAISSKRSYDQLEFRGYKTLVDDLLTYQDNNLLPENIKLDELNDGKGILDFFIQNAVRWHRSCRMKVDKAKFERDISKKRKSSPENLPDVSDVDVEFEDGKKCFICDQDEFQASITMRCITSMDMIGKIKACAEVINDYKLFKKCEDIKFVLPELRYHANCIITIYNKRRSLERSLSEKTTDFSDLHQRVLNELILHIKETERVFTLVELSKLYECKFKSLSKLEEYHINHTRLKEKLTTDNAGLEYFFKGKTIFIASSNIFQRSLKNERDQEMNWDRLTKSVRDDMKLMSNKFKGQFNVESQINSVPPSLLKMVCYLLYGKNEIKSNEEPQIVLTIAQLILFNSKSCKNREVPLAVYIAMKIHSQTRQKKLVETFYDLGLCISYDRLMDINTELANNSCEVYNVLGKVCPIQLMPGNFITAAFDNIDHNPSANTATDSFHGTAISITQHSLLETNSPYCEYKEFKTCKSRKLMDLPESYTNIKPYFLNEANIKAPIASYEYYSDCESEIYSKCYSTQTEWLANIKSVIGNNYNILPANINVSWSAYNANVSESKMNSSHSVMMPLFQENSNSSTMVHHAMKVIQEATQHINPDQVSSGVFLLYI